MWKKLSYQLLKDFFIVTSFLSVVLLLGELYLKPPFFTISFLLLLLGSLLPVILVYTIPVGFFYSLSYHIFITHLSGKIILFEMFPRFKARWVFFIGGYSFLSFLLYLLILGWGGPLMQSHLIKMLQAPDLLPMIYPADTIIPLRSGISIFFKEKKNALCKKLFLAVDHQDQRDFLLWARIGLFKKSEIKMHKVEGAMNDQQNALLLLFFVKDLSLSYETDNDLQKSSMRTIYQLYKKQNKADKKEFYKRLFALFMFVFFPFLAWKVGFYAAQKKQGLSCLLFFTLSLLLFLYIILNVFF